MAEELYRVEKEEKLSDIARRFGLSEEKLKVLNPDMRTFGGLFSKDVYVGVNQFIKVSEGKVIIKTDDVDFDFNNNYEAKQQFKEKYRKLICNPEENKIYKYKIDISQKLCANDKIFVNIQNEIDWQIVYKKNEHNNMFVNIDVESYSVNNQSSSIDKLMDFAMLFNQPTKELIIELGELGSISKVANQKTVFEKWLTLRKENLGEYQNDIAMKGIFVAGDTEFSNTLPSLLANPLYFLFFDKVYEKTLQESTYYNEKKILYSKLFQGKQISLANKQIFRLKTDFSIENEYISKVEDDKEIKDFFMINYKDLVGNVWDYQYKVKSIAKYHLDFGILKHLEASSIEKANNNLFHETNYKIQLID